MQNILHNRYAITYFQKIPFQFAQHQFSPTKMCKNSLFRILLIFLIFLLPESYLCAKSTDFKILSLSSLLSLSLLLS